MKNKDIEMKEELEQIGLKLKKWCTKYNKDYVDVCFTEDVIMANLNPDDEDYKKCYIYIKF